MDQISITRQVSKREDIDGIISDVIAIVEKHYKRYTGNITVTFEDVMSTRRTDQKESQTMPRKTLERIYPDGFYRRLEMS